MIWWVDNGERLIVVMAVEANISKDCWDVGNNGWGSIEWRTGKKREEMI